MALQKLNLLPLNVFQTAKRYFHSSTSKCKTFRQMYRDFWTTKSSNQPPYSHVTQVGDPVLRSAAAEVPQDMLNSKEIDVIVDQMVQVLRKYNCVGLAAPQIGVSLRIIVMEFREDLNKKFTKEVYEARKMSPLPLTVSVALLVEISHCQVKFLYSLSEF